MVNNSKLLPVNGVLPRHWGAYVLAAHVSCQTQTNNGDQQAEPDRVGAAEEEAFQIGSQGGEKPKGDEQFSELAGIAAIGDHDIVAHGQNHQNKD